MQLGSIVRNMFHFDFNPVASFAPILDRLAARSYIEIQIRQKIPSQPKLIGALTPARGHPCYLDVTAYIHADHGCLRISRGCDIYLD